MKLFILAALLSLTAVVTALKGQLPVAQRPAVFDSLSAPVDASAEPSPYAFEYDSPLGARKESSDGQTVRGFYTLLGADGIRRIVNYVADRDGFRAAIATNEPGTEAQSPADVTLQSSQPKAEELARKYGPSYVQSVDISAAASNLDEIKGATPVRKSVQAVKGATPILEHSTKGLKRLPVLRSPIPVLPVVHAPVPIPALPQVAHAPPAVISKVSQAKEEVYEQQAALPEQKEDEAQLKDEQLRFESVDQTVGQEPLPAALPQAPIKRQLRRFF